MWLSDFPYHKELLLKERICSQREQIFSFILKINYEDMKRITA